MVDREAISQLENKIREIKRQPETKDLYYTALVYYFTGNETKANESLQKFLKSEPDSSDGLTLVGWLTGKTNRKAASKYFASALQKVFILKYSKIYHKYL